jgi:hypothetical protein
MMLGGWCGEIDGHVHYIARILSHAASLGQAEADRRRDGDSTAQPFVRVDSLEVPQSCTNKGGAPSPWVDSALLC